MRSDALASIIGKSIAIRELRMLIARVAPTRLPVLIEGPTGAGKELVARALHALSGRRGSIIAFNVCAHPEALFEDALFGHVRGAFTSAIGESTGYLAQADGGTLFLDEIGGLALPLQAKLLRALETGEFRQVGASKDRRSDFRVVAAINEPIEEIVASGRFRADLAHRLAGLVIRVPALRDRIEDLPALAQHFVGNSTGLNGGVRLTRDALRALMAYDWPGNVRELRQIVERALALATNDAIGGSDVYAAMGKGMNGSKQLPGGSARAFIDTLQNCCWDTEDAADRLGIHRSTVYRRMKRLGLLTQFRTRYPRAMTQ
jgi:DNA-binding NtrC family response regulator